MEKTGMENNLRAVLDTLPGLVWTALPDGRVDFLSQHWCEYTGRNFDEGYGVGWQTAIHPEDMSEFVGHWQAILASGESGKMEARLRRFDGEYRRFILRIRPFVDATGRVAKWCGMGIDIDELRSEDLQGPYPDDTHTIADSIPALIAFMTPEGEIESVNRHILEYFGTTLEKLKSGAVGDTVHPDDRPAVVAAWRHAVATATPYEMEHRLRRENGDYRWFHVRGQPVCDAEGRVTRWYLLQTDVDDRRRAEALLAGEKRLLEMVARSDPMSGILQELCRLVENTARACYCSVVLVDQSGTHLEHGAAPSLPSSFIGSIIGRPVNVDSGPCAMASCLNQQVIAHDLTTEPRWAAYAWCRMALAHGLQACWSTPILSTTGKVLGAFALYYDQPRAPTSLEQSLIEQFMHIASIAIERAQTDMTLKRSEVRKAAILDSALDCIVTMDHEGCITEFNPAAERTFGYRRDEILGEPLADVIIPPSLRDKHREGLARYLMSSDARVLGKRVEMTAMRADGSEFPVEVAITRIPLDGPAAFTGYLRDITERQQSEERLRRSEAFLAEAQHLSSTGSFGWSIPRGEVFWSDETFRIFEYDPTTIPTVELVLQRVHPEDTPRVRQTIERASQDGQDFAQEYRLRMPDGRTKYVGVVAHGARDESGNVDFVGAVMDITERKLAEADRERLGQRLRQVEKMEAIGRLASGIAHDFNNVLSGVIAFGEMLLEEAPQDSARRRHAQNVLTAADRGRGLVHQILAYSRSQRGKRTPIDVGRIVTETLELVRGSLAPAMRLDVDLPMRPMIVIGDTTQLHQVVMNLCSNAIHATGRTGTVRVALAPAEVPGGQAFSHGTLRQGRYACLTVVDKGCGMDEATLAHLFEPFFTTKEIGRGTGLGLSLVDAIVADLGGAIDVKSALARGSTFSVYLPLAQTSAEMGA